MAFPSAGAGQGVNRVKRGGSWNNNAANCRAANRNRNTPDKRNNNLGFRPAPAPPAPESEDPNRMEPASGPVPRKRANRNRCRRTPVGLWVRPKVSGGAQVSGLPRSVGGRHRI
jgi:hypothetical protein